MSEKIFTSEQFGQLNINELEIHKFTLTADGKVAVRIVGGSGGSGGDMYKVVYDTNNSGVVDDSEALNGQAGSYYLNRQYHTGMQSIDTISETATKKVMTDVERDWILNDRGSYVVSSNISLGTPDPLNDNNITTFNLEAEGFIKDNGQVYSINVNQTEIDITNIANESATYVIVDKTGTIIQQDSPPTTAQMLNHLCFWVVVHSNNQTANTVNNISLKGNNVLNQFHAYAKNFGYVNLNGNEYSPNGANLKIDKTAGEIMYPGLGENNQKAQNAITEVPFRIRNQDGTETLTDITDLDVENYDNGGTTTPIPGATNSVWAVYRIFLFADQNITRLARPQFYYDNQDEALLNFRNENFVLEKNFKDNGTFVGYILFRKNTTDLTSSENQFLPPEGLGSFGGTAFTPTLNAVYNVSGQPQITTTIGEIQLKGGETDTDNVLVIQDTTGNTTISMKANGTVVDNTDVIIKSYLDTQLSGKEDSFTKNTAFNKNFGTTAGTVLEGNTDVGKVGTKSVDETDIANGRILSYNSTSGNIEYIALSGGGDMLASVYDQAGGARQVAFADELFSGAYGDLTGAPTLGTMSAEDTTSYYTNTQVDNLLSGKSDTSHTHTTSDITDLSSYTGLDARYYTETEIDNLLSGKEDSFTKNTAFNKNFGTTAGTVLEGNTNLGIVGTKTVDETAIGDDKILVYKTATGDLVYETKPTGGGGNPVLSYNTNNNLPDTERKVGASFFAAQSGTVSKITYDGNVNTTGSNGTITVKKNGTTIGTVTITDGTSSGDTTSITGGAYVQGDEIEIFAVGGSTQAGGGGYSVNIIS